jgi:hypothetical protein
VVVRGFRRTRPTFFSHFHYRHPTPHHPPPVVTDNNTNIVYERFLFFAIVPPPQSYIITDRPPYRCTECHHVCPQPISTVCVSLSPVVCLAESNRKPIYIYTWDIWSHTSVPLTFLSTILFLCTRTRLTTHTNRGWENSYSPCMAYANNYHTRCPPADSLITTKCKNTFFARSFLSVLRLSVEQALIESTD